MNIGIIGDVDGPTSVTTTVKLGPVALVILFIAVIIVIAVTGFFIWKKIKAKR